MPFWNPIRVPNFWGHFKSLPSVLRYLQTSSGWGCFTSLPPPVYLVTHDGCAVCIISTFTRSSSFWGWTLVWWLPVGGTRLDIIDIDIDRHRYHAFSLEYQKLCAKLFCEVFGGQEGVERRRQWRRELGGRKRSFKAKGTPLGKVRM